MDTPVALDLEALGRRAGEQVAAAGALELVEVRHVENAEGDPTYKFRFVMDQARVGEGSGRLRVRLGQKLRDELLAKGDEHHPMLELLSRDDWDRLRSA